MDVRRTSGAELRDRLAVTGNHDRFASLCVRDRSRELSLEVLN
jgi:hypothetical protein